MSQVNLLPPELRARQKTRQQTTLIVGGGVALIVLLLGFWFLQGQKLAGVNDDVAAQNLTNSGLQTQIDQLQDFQQLQEQAAAQQALLAKAFSGEVSFSQMLMDISRTIPIRRLSRLLQRQHHGPGRGSGRHHADDQLRRFVHGRRRGRRLRELGELADPSRIREGLGEPLLLERHRDGPEHRPLHVHEQRRPVPGLAHRSRPRRRAGWGVSAHRSSPASASRSPW